MKRYDYDLVFSEQYGHYEVNFKEDSDGDWVLFSEADTEIKRLREALERIRRIYTKQSVWNAEMRIGRIKVETKNALKDATS